MQNAADLPVPSRAPGATLPMQAINGWRGPGAIAIAIAHFAVMTDFYGVDHFQRIAVLVDLFFVLSGVLIAQSYGTKLTRAAAIPEYVVRRFGRIWPVHAATLGVLVVYECGKSIVAALTGKTFFSAPFSADGINLPAAIPTNLLLVHSLGIHDRETWNFPSWSLSVEFAVYIVFALFCLCTPIVRRVLAVTTIVLSLAVLIWVAPNGMRSTYDYGIFRCLAGFFAGTLIYEIAVRWPLPRWRMPTLVESLTLGAVLVWIELSEQTWMVYAAPFIFCAIILVYVGEGGALSRLFKTRLFQKGADLSFAIYMVHAIVLIGFMIVMHEYERRTNHALFITTTRPWRGQVQLLHIGSSWLLIPVIALYVAVVLLVAIAAHNYVELPGRVVFNRWAKQIKTRRREPLPRPVAQQDVSEPGF